MSIVYDHSSVQHRNNAGVVVPSAKVAVYVHTAYSISRYHFAPSLVGVAAGSENIPPPVEASLFMKYAMSGVSAPYATFP